ncbi:putrescine transport system substrate-binding protein [Sinobacterium caligoides]|uniref:Putrescine-binding periplasmic protein n=1 Tax=Sinobacterium caligoides TaxID=933926 RepID=A0A3N2DK78_9GAMM|nr:polyamine ABC transporter substrate-binding protein [Sinobacterium caligoides]ROS00089.1 putrescine transport system substrate-binding protein [Sinobacterium caligoides]
MSNKWLRPILLVLLLMFSMSIESAEQRVLNIYNWSDYIAPATIENFERHSGIKVIYDVFDSNDTLEVKLLTGKSGYDIVVPSNNFLARQIQAGLFQPLDKSKLPLYVNLDPQLMKRLEASDPDNLYGIPYLWGTTGLGFNVAMLKERLGERFPLDSWNLLLDPMISTQLRDCGVGILDAWDELFPIIFNYIGEDPSTHDVKVFKGEAYRQMNRLRPNVATIHSSSYIKDLAAGDLCLALGWVGDVYQARTRALEAGSGIDVSYIIPKEGAPIWFDMIAIPKDAPNPDEAHEFINFLLQPEVIAEISNYVAYPNAVPASKPFLDEALRNNANIYPDEEVMKRLFVLEVYPASIDRFAARLWGRFRAHH